MGDTVEQPQHLATIVPAVAISRWDDYAYGQGVRFLSGYGTPLLFDYGFNQAASPPSVSGPVTEKAVDDVRPCDNVEHQDRGYAPDPVYDAWWAERDYRALAHNVQVPALVEGSWTDYNVHPLNTIRMWDRLKHADPRHRLVMGLQGHRVTTFIDPWLLHHAWFDRYLRGRDTDVETMPRVQSEPSGGVTPQDSNKWPPAGSVTDRLPLATATAPGVLGGGAASWQDINPLLGEDDVLAGRGGPAATIFRTEPATKPIRLAGTPRLHLRVTTDATETQVTPVLFTESPTGTTTVFTRGLLNALNRDGIDTSKPLVPGVPWEGVVDFQPVDHVLQDGHRLGVALMSMNIDEALYPDESRATNVLSLDGASYLDITRSPAPDA